MESDERDEITEQIWKKKRGLHFFSLAIPISKQSKDKIKKDLSKKIMQDQVRGFQRFKDHLTTYYPEGDLELELIFGIKRKRYTYKKNDVDNLVKHTLDCLKGYLFKDDSQIKRLCATKYILNNNHQECTGIIISTFKSINNNNN